MYLWSLAVDDTDLCVRVTLMVAHKTHLALSVISKLGTTSGAVMHDPWAVDGRPPVQLWVKFEA